MGTYAGTVEGGTAMIATMITVGWILIKLDAPVWVWCLFIIGAALGWR